MRYRLKPSAGPRGKGRKTQLLWRALYEKKRSGKKKGLGSHEAKIWRRLTGG